MAISIIDNFSIENTGGNFIIKGGTPSAPTTLLTIAVSSQNVSITGDINLSTGAIKNDAPGIVISAGSTNYISMNSVTDAISILGTITLANLLVTNGATLSSFLSMGNANGTYLKVAQQTTAQRDALTPAEGMMIYNTTTDKFQGYANGVWVDFH